MAKKQLSSNKQLARSIGFRKYKPIRHFETRSGAESLRHDLTKSFKTLSKRDVKVCYEGKIGRTKVYSLLARTKRQQQLARRTIKHTMIASKWKRKKR